MGISDYLHSIVPVRCPELNSCLAHTFWCRGFQTTSPHLHTHLRTQTPWSGERAWQPGVGTVWGICVPFPESPSSSLPHLELWLQGVYCPHLALVGTSTHLNTPPHRHIHLHNWNKITLKKTKQITKPHFFVLCTVGPWFGGVLKYMFF